MSDQETDWFAIAQAAAQTAQEIAGESVQHRIEANRLRALSQGKDHQIEIYQGMEETIQKGRTRMKQVLDLIEFLQDKLDFAVEAERDQVREIIGPTLLGQLTDINTDEIRKECGCGAPDPE
jgi:hypothetical protein